MDCPAVCEALIRYSLLKEAKRCTSLTNALLLIIFCNFLLAGALSIAKYHDALGTDGLTNEY